MVPECRAGAVPSNRRLFFATVRVFAPAPSGFLPLPRGLAADPELRLRHMNSGLEGLFQRSVHSPGSWALGLELLRV